MFSIFLFVFASDASCHMQVELMKKKLPWLKYDLKKVEYIEAKKQEAEAKKKMDEAAKVLNDLKRPVEYALLAVSTIGSCNFFISRYRDGNVMDISGYP